MPLETALQSDGCRSSSELERTCVVLLEAELDIAFGFLRLAGAEARNGNAVHADELIAKASRSYKEVVDGLANVPLEFEEERQMLRERVRILQDAIRAVARRRQQDFALH